MYWLNNIVVSVKYHGKLIKASSNNVELNWSWNYALYILILGFHLLSIFFKSATYIIIVEEEVVEIWSQLFCKIKLHFRIVVSFQRPLVKSFLP